jgi:ribonuclease T1
VPESGIPCGRRDGRRGCVTLLGLLLALGVSLVGCGPPAATATAPPTSTATQSSGSALSAPRTEASCPAPNPNTPGAATSHLPLRSLCALPAQAAQVWRTIATGGRPGYARDGIVFNNNERRLPSEPRGYYHEYTVPTPGAPTRGTRRLITGSARELYYTGDHYNTFVVVDATAN